VNNGLNKYSYIQWQYGHVFLKKRYKRPEFDKKYDTTLDDVDAVFNDSEVSYMESVT
jgi:hypothetical protein